MGNAQGGEGLSILNPAPSTLPGPSLLHELIGRDGHHDKNALDFLSGSGERLGLSYTELEVLSDRLAHRISRELEALPPRDSGEGVIIPLLIPQSPDLYVAIVAILKSGAAYCPLNLDAPAERIRFILQDTQARLVLATSSLSSNLEQADPSLKILSVDHENGIQARSTGECPPERLRRPDPSDLAYVMYTSGSTGTPKGVGISHTAATQSLLAHDGHIPPFSRFLQFAAPTFDVSVFEIFFPLFRGGTLVSCDRALMLTDLPGVIRRLDVDACELTPSVAGSLLRSRANAPCLQLLLTIGEMLTEPVVGEFGGDSTTPSILWGMYGPTEAAIHCTLQPAFARDLSPRCIGFPLDTVSAFVVRYDETDTGAPPFEILPVGQVGELAVGGYQLATGYLNRPEQTAAAFVNTEFGRVYKTGDKARILPDGTIECLGRVSEGQIKLNGQRMELGEVEHAVLRTPGCHSAYVCVISNIIVAFAAAEIIDGMREQIRTNCKSWLPAFMVPSEIIVKEAFPRLASGKIDRMALKQEYIDIQSETADDIPAHKDELERMLCEVAAEIFHASTQMSTRLSSVGLDSLSAIQFAARLRERGIPANTMDILEMTTLSDLHIRLTGLNSKIQPEPELNGNASPSPTELIEALSVDSIHHDKAGYVESITPCTALQTSMIVESLKDPRLYRNTVQVRFQPGFDPSVLKCWFFEAAQRNEILRSGFISLGDTIVRVTWKRLLDTQVRLVDSLPAEEITDIDEFLEHPLQIDIERDRPQARITLHHAIYDGWTFDLLLDDLTSLALGKTLPSRPQFSDLAKYLDGATSVLEETTAREFWAEHLRGSPGSSLPNFKTTAIVKPEISSLSRRIGISHKALKTIASEAGFSPQSLFQGCLAWLWGAITGTEDVIFGTVFSGRTLPVTGIEQVMGPCLLTLPTRVNLSESSTIADLIQNLHAINRSIMRLAPIRLTDIKRAARLPIGASLFDVLLVYQESLSSRKRSVDVIAEMSHEDRLETKLLLEIEPRDDCFLCQWTWHSDAFSKAQVNTFAQHFDHLGQYFAQHLDATLSSVSGSFLPQSLSAYTSGMRPITTEPSLASLVEKTVSSSPDAEALYFAHSITPSTMETESWTYQQINSSANRIARYLRAKGAYPGGVVAIIMEKSPSLYCSILGILKAGCGYLPLLPSTPRKRVQRVMETAQPLLCLVDSVSLWDGLSLPCDLVELHSPELETYDESNLGIEQDTSQLAYVIFTSGTTGTPKGVSVTNQNTLSNIEVLSRIYPFQKSSRMIQSCSQAFDLSVFEIFFTWANGFTLCAATNDTLFQDLELSFRQLEVTHFYTTVSMASLVDPANTPTVTFVNTSGEPMTEEVMDKWAHVLYQGYGPSETTNIFTVRKVAPGDSIRYLGWSFENSSAFIFDPESDDILPIGCLGEICVGGDQVAAGYLNMPELTAQKFVQHPQYGRLYRSGDLGRMLPDGSLIIQGRIDSQVKLRGQRIELHEVQSVVLGSQSAKACSCVLLEREGVKSRQLALFYVPATEEDQAFNFLPMSETREREARDIMQLLMGSLPAYMIPSFIFPISRLPLTSSGKVNNEHLRQLTTTLLAEELDRYSLSGEFVEDSTEWTEVERTISHVLADVLKVESKNIGRLTTFAVLGLDSISAAPVARRLSQHFEKRIPLSQVLQNPNISRLAHSITTEVTSSSRAKSELLPPGLMEVVRSRFQDGVVENVLPCTPLQTAMLAASASSAKSAYLNQMLFRIRRPLEELIGFWNQMRVRHEILRTCFVSTEDSQHPLVQVVLEPGPLSWAQLRTADLERCASEHRDSLPSAIDSLSPPLSLAAIEALEGECYISFVCHHALYDGVAMGILLSEIEALALGQRLQPAPSFTPFLQEALALPEDVDKFWQNHFQGFQSKPVPRGVMQVNGFHDDLTPSSSRCTLPLSPIEARLQEIGFSLLSLCQASWSETLSSVTKGSDVCFGNVFSGRTIPLEEVGNLVAPCFNTVPMRVRVSSVKSNRDLMKTCQTTNAEMLQYQFTSLRKVHSLVNNDHLFDTLLLLQPPAEPLNQDIWSLERESGSMDVPIVCEVVPSPEQDELQIFMHADSEIIPEDIPRILREVFVEALTSCLRYPSSQPGLTARLPTHLRALLQNITPPKSKTLESPDNSDSSLAASEPWSEHEVRVREVVAKLSGVPQDKIRKHTSIHRYGLDSISAVQISYLLRQMRMEVSAFDVLENPTCADIASCVKSLDSPQTSTSRPYDLLAFTQSTEKQVAAAKLPYEPQAILPCTPLQQGMLSQFLLSSGANYFNFISWDLDDEADCCQLEKAWKTLATRREILRAGFISISHPDTSFAMVVYGDESIEPSVKRLTAEDTQLLNVGNWRRQAAANALENLSRPPWQVLLVDKPGSKSMHLGMHHALYDAFSLQLMMNELLQILEKKKLPAATGIEMAISSVLGQIVNQEQDAEAFWKQRALDIVVNPFPVLTPLRINPGQRPRISRVSDIPLQRLRDGAATAGVTMQAALQSAWGRILASYTGEGSATFGVVLSGRTAGGLDEAFMPCIITLPVIARSMFSNRESLQSMMDQNAALRRYEHTPLTRIQRWVGSSESPLFDTILVYQQAVGSLQGQMWHIHDEAATVDYPVSLEVEESHSGELRYSIDFQSNILPSEQAGLLLAQFDSILIHLLEFPDGMADDLSAHHPELYSILPAEHDELPSEAALMHQIVEQTAARLPDALALEFVSGLEGGIRSRKWTYRELDQTGNRVAHLLTSQGIKPGGIVAVVFEKCPEAYFTILGILKAGCAYVALDPSAPAARHEFILQDSGAVALLVEGGKTSDVTYSPPCPLLEIKLSELESYSSTPIPSADILPDATCYCLYTSGTTGTPKGCLITHDNAVQAMLAFRCLFEGHWDGDSRWLQFASFHFDVSVLEQYWSWLVGIPVISAPRDLILSDLIATISKLEITHIDLTPSLARLVHPDEVPSLCKGVFITGGEQLRQDILDAWGSKEVIYNAYGPTEATIGVTTYCRVPQNGRSTNIGKQFPNVGSYVVRPGTDVPVLRGGVGELCVSGKLVGKGYLNRDDLTRERFPVLAGYGDRVYRTGDLVRVLYDGCFDFLGRADDQVKLRGQRLEIGEINHAIKTGVPEVADVATIVTKHRGQDRDVIVSFVVTEDSDRKQDLAILSDSNSPKLCLSAQDACRAKLPGYMVPTYVLCVPYIPLSANNKAQTSILKQIFNDTSPEQLISLSSAASNGSALLKESEPVLARILAGITRTEMNDIRPSSTIFELGIDSIAVIELSRQLRAAGFSGATPSTVLQHPRLSALARALKKPTDSNSSQVLRAKQSILACYHQHLSAVCSVFGVPRSDVEYIAPCTPLQEGMLSRSVTSEGRSAYFNTFQLDMRSDVSATRLKEAWEDLVGETAVLRTRFLQTLDGHIQAALKGGALRWHEVQLDEDVELSQYLDQRHEIWIHSNKDVFRNPLEVDYIQHGERQVLVVRIFHGIYDARSFDLVLERIATLYDGLSNHTAPISKSFIDVLPHGPLADYSGCRHFWEDLFHDFELKPIPTLPQAGGKDAIVSRCFSVAGLEEKRISFGVTQQTIVQAAWLSALLRHFKSWHSLGVILSGRSLVLDGIENTIGPLFNTLPFRVKESSVHDWGSLIQEVHNFNAAVLSFTHTPLRQIQKWCSHGQPLFDNLFTFDRSASPSADSSSGLWTKIDSISAADYPLAFEGIVSRENVLAVTVVAQAHIADRSILEELLDGFQRALYGLEMDDDFPETNSGVAESSAAVNGIGYSPEIPNVNSDDTFIETEEARNVRTEIASLAGVSQDEIGETTTLFELGLDSIDAIKLVARLRRIGISITTSQLIKQPSVRGIMTSSSRANAINGSLPSQSQQLNNQKQRLAEHLKTTGHDLTNVESVLPPTPLQDSMAAEMVLSDFRRYFNHDILRVSPGVDAQLLKEALRSVIRSSPVLRTAFIEVDDPSFNFAYAQVIMKDTDPFQPTVAVGQLQDVDAVLEAARNRAVQACAASGLLQITPVELANDHYFVLSISHALYDGASLDLFHRDVRAAYSNAYAPRNPYEPVLAKVIASSSESATAFWSAFLNDAPHTNLSQSSHQTDDSETVVHRAEMVSHASDSEMRAFCKRHRITLQTLGQACWAVVLGSLIKSLHVTFGVVLSGRATEEEQALMFPTMNTVPVRAILHGTTSEYMQYMWDNLANITEYQHFPLRKAQKLAGSGHGPLFNTLFTMRSRISGDTEDNSPVWESVQSASEVEYPLCVEMEVVGSSMTWRIACDDKYATKGGAQDLLDQLDQVLGYFLTNENGQIIDFPSGTGTVSVCGLPPFTFTSDIQDEEPSSNGTDTIGTPEWSETESKVVGVLAEVAGIDRQSILPGHSIYHIGLDSISAIKAASILRKRGVVVSVRDLVKATSIRDMAAKTKGTRAESVTTNGGSGSLASGDLIESLDMEKLVAKAGLDLASVERVLPALPIQVHMLCTWEHTKGDVFFYEFSYDISGNLTLETAERAWQTLVAETPILRTHFVSTGSRQIPFAQIILGASQKPQNVLSESHGNNWCYHADSSPFVSIRLSGTTPGKGELHIKIHHAIYDGVSLPMMIGRFRQLCNSITLPARPADHSWNQFVLQHYTQAVKQKRQNFWKAYLKDVSLQPSHTNSVTQAQIIRTSEFKPSVLYGMNSLKVTASSRGIGVQAIFLAAYAKVLARSSSPSTGQDLKDVVFGVYLANRTSFDDSLQDAPFPTLSIVPLRVRLSEGEGEPLVDVAQRVQADLKEISSFENASAGLWEIAEWTGVRVDSFVNFLSIPHQEKDSGESRATGAVQFTDTTPAVPPERQDDANSNSSLGIARPGDQWLSENQVKDAYIDCVDVEASVNDESMSIGVFGPSSLLSRTQASGLIDGIVKLLQGI